MNELPDIVAFVAKWPPFDRLGGEDLEHACRRASVSYSPAGTELLPFGGDNDELHMVRKGAVGLYDEHDELADKRDAGELFGYPSMLTGQPVRLAVRTLEDTLLYHFPAAAIRPLRGSNPDFDRFFSARLAERVASGLRARVTGTLASVKVGDLMSSPAVSVQICQSVADAAAIMDERKVSALTVIEDGELRGILTDRDLRSRVVARRLAYDAPLTRAMTPEPATCTPQEVAIAAQLTMLERGVHHLPVAEEGRPVGMLTLSDLLRAQNDEPVYFIGSLRRCATVEALARAARRRFDLFARLVRGGVDAGHVQRVLTAVTDATTQRLITLAHQELGPAPMSYAWICFGSEARREQTGRTDQDNGLVLERECEDGEAAWFGRFADFVCDGLDAAGYVYCPGGIMAKSPEWRMSLRAWQRHFARWIREPEPRALMFAAIFFDQRCVGGTPSLVEALRREVFAMAQDNSIFLRHMAANALEQRPPISFFGKFILEENGEQSRGLNLKQRGVVPIVALARLKALELGIEEPETIVRLRLAAERGRSRDDVGDLLDAMELMGRVRNEHQAAQIAAGREPDNLVAPDGLSPLTRRHLKAAFHVVRRAQQVLGQLPGVT